MTAPAPRDDGRTPDSEPETQPDPDAGWWSALYTAESTAVASTGPHGPQPSPAGRERSTGPNATGIRGLLYRLLLQLSRRRVGAPAS